MHEVETEKQQLEESNVGNPMKQSSEPQLLTETLDQEYTSEMAKLVLSEGDPNFSEAFWHWTQNTPMVYFVSKPENPYPWPVNSGIPNTQHDRIAHHRG
jgi:hypothetical protein